MPARVTTRPLRDILFDVTVRDRPVTKALAEEAARAVAADGVITQSEVDALEPFADGVQNAARMRRAESSAWKDGTQAGRALFNGLADTVDAIYAGGNFEARRSTPMPAYNPFAWWGGGWSSASTRVNDKPVPVTAAELLSRTREEGSGWLHGDFERLLAKYPKATSDRYSMELKPKAAVQQAYNRIKSDWLKGKITDERDLMVDLKPLLDARYR